MHILQIKIDVSPRKKGEFEHAISQMLAPQQSEHSKCTMSLDIQEPNMFIYTEEWEAENPMRDHFKDEDFRSLLGAMKALGTIKDAKVITSNSIKDFKFD